INCGKYEDISRVKTCIPREIRRIFHGIHKGFHPRNILIFPAVYPSYFQRNIVTAWLQQRCNLMSSGISFLLAVETFFTGSGNFFWQWELHNCSGNSITGSGNTLCILFPTILP
nr:hypothetical protein [Tanacetum cinerariifolium]